MALSFWKRLFGGSKTDEGETDALPAEAPTESSAPAQGAAEAAETAAAQQRAKAAEEQLQQLRQLGRPGGAEVDDALAILRHHQGSTRQTKVLHAILEGLDALGVGAPSLAPGQATAPSDGKLDALLVACASLLEARGQQREALELVSASRSVAGMLLGADLHAAAGQLPRAVSTVERVMARAIDTPGARERHDRWLAQLGRGARPQVVDDGATVVAPAVQDAAFRILREVARGGAGTIYEAEDELLGRRLAFKVYHRAGDDHDQIEREARTAVQLAGPGVVRLFDAHPEEGWLASEWCPRGSLRDMLRDGLVGEVLPLSRWLPAMIAALERVHAAGLVHSDLKPGNVLFRAPDDPLLADFGSCVPKGNAGLAGTPGYLAPERLEGSAAHPSDDVYAVGRIIEDVLAATEDAGLEPAQLAEYVADGQRWARIALRCLSAAADRPANATELTVLNE
ncbi:MAG: serine/threonine protein kinase [Deltaproteobacteria bacterium]|nr:serine/threonine protein kinase [Deltaproteobacteria bacterium]